MFSAGGPFVGPFYRVTILLKMIFDKRMNRNFAANWHKWSSRQAHETINFRVRRSKFKVTGGRRFRVLAEASFSTAWVE